MIADAVRLTRDQIASLDKIASSQDDITRLDRDMMIAMRGRAVGARFESTVDCRHRRGRPAPPHAPRHAPRSTDPDAGSERTILSQDQWQTLQQQLQDRRSQRRQDNGYPAPRGRGMGGRGRFPVRLFIRCS